LQVSARSIVIIPSPTIEHKMSIPVEGRVTLQNNRAVVVLNVAASSQAEERPASSTPRQSLAAMVCNVQKGLKLEPVGLHGAWNAARNCWNA
jgi:hypothetical protein